MLRMAEDDRRDAEGKASGTGQCGMGIHVRGSGLQSGAHAEAAGQSGWCPMSQGRSVPAVNKTGPRRPQKETFGLCATILGREYPQLGKMRVTA